jgi:catechol 2,3-dioxygenase-like lactoylglutathione lyase family enzyme
MSDVAEESARARAWPTGIFAITLFTENLELAREFYQNVFGLPIEYKDSNSAVFKFGGTLVNLLKISEAGGLIEPARVAGREAGARYVFTIRVEDVDGMCAELVGRGVKLLNGPLDRPWGIRTASFMDPSGHIWEIAK